MKFVHFSTSYSRLRASFFFEMMFEWTNEQKENFVRTFSSSFTAMVYFCAYFAWIFFIVWGHLPKSHLPYQILILRIKRYLLEYDEVRDLPEYDFSERVQLLKKLHCDLSGTLLRGNCKRPTSSACKRKTNAKKKKSCKSSKNAISPSLCNVRFFRYQNFNARKIDYIEIVFFLPENVIEL